MYSQHRGATHRRWARSKDLAARSFAAKEDRISVWASCARLQRVRHQRAVPKPVCTRNQVRSLAAGSELPMTRRTQTSFRRERARGFRVSSCLAEPSRQKASGCLGMGGMPTASRLRVGATNASMLPRFFRRESTSPAGRHVPRALSRNERAWIRALGRRRHRVPTGRCRAKITERILWPRKNSRDVPTRASGIGPGAIRLRARAWAESPSARMGVAR
jgi:hypothetical protein